MGCLGIYARARNLLKMPRAVVAEHDANSRRSTPPCYSYQGIGPLTPPAAVSLLSRWTCRSRCGRHVERVMARVLMIIHTPLPRRKADLMARAEVLQPQAIRPGRITPKRA